LEKLFDLPRADDPLQLDQLSTDTHDLLDECYRQTLSSSVVDSASSILIFFAVGMGPQFTAKSVRRMKIVCNIPDRQLLKMFTEENSLLKIYGRQKFKYVSTYFVPQGLRDFLFDPIRSRCFCPTSWIIDRCQLAMKKIDSNVPSHFHSNLLTNFLWPQAAIGISNASRLLEHVRNGSDKNDLLPFLTYLSELCWFDIYTRSNFGRQVANRIVHWVYTTLVG
jgi:hypothetical protein